MSTDPAQIATTASWVATGLGVGLWLYSWVRESDPIQKLRFQDCGLVLVFASILTRILVQERAMGLFDWAMLILGPLFIAAALWRLARTSSGAGQ